jgi:hypothetical protein
MFLLADLLKGPGLILADRGAQFMYLMRKQKHISLRTGMFSVNAKI